MMLKVTQINNLVDLQPKKDSLNTGYRTALLRINLMKHRENDPEILGCIVTLHKEIEYLY